MRHTRWLTVAILTVGLLAPPSPAAAETEPLWVASYAAPSGGESYVNEVVLDPTTGNVVVLGSTPRITSQFGQEYNRDYATLGYRPDGQLLGVQVYEYRGPREPGVQNRDDVAYATAVHPTNGSVYVTGYSEGSAESGVDVATVAYDRRGRQQWVARYAEPTDDDGRYLAVAPQSGTVVVGGVQRTPSGAGLDWVVLGYSPLGQLLWSDRFDLAGDADDLNGIAVDPVTDTVYAAGTVTTEAGDTDVALRAYSPAGELLWMRQFDDGGDEEGQTLAVDAGQVYVAGSGERSGETTALLTLAYSATGDHLWDERYTKPNSDFEAQEVAVDPVTHDVVVFGQRSVAPLSIDFATVVYRSTGQLRWAAGYNNLPGNDEDYPSAVAVDPTRGLVYVIGSSRGSLNFVWTMIAYRLSDGVQLRFDTFGTGRETGGIDVAVDSSSGTVYMTGPNEGDITTVAYPPAG